MAGEDSLYFSRNLVNGRYWKASTEEGRISLIAGMSEMKAYLKPIHPGERYRARATYGEIKKLLDNF
jgi:hypothetical protein